MNSEELKRDFILLNTGYAYHQADWNWEGVHSPFTRIHYVKRGSAKIIREEGVYELKEGHLYLTPAYVKHSYACDGELELYYIHLYEDLRKSLSMFDIIDFPVEINASTLDPPLIERLITINPGRELQYYDPESYNSTSTVAHHIFKQQNTPLAYEMETHGIIEQLFSRFLVQANYKNRLIEKRIMKVLLHIHRNLDKTIEIDHLAEMCFLSKDHFIRLFRKEMQSTPRKYINRKKIEKAQLQILVSNASIKDVAYDLGFDNVSYFNRLFLEITGESPGRYRKFNS